MLITLDVWRFEFVLKGVLSSANRRKFACRSPIHKRLFYEKAGLDSRITDPHFWNLRITWLDVFKEHIIHLKYKRIK